MRPGFNYAEAAEMSFRVVRDRLRFLTGYERGADAFSKRELHVKGAIAHTSTVISMKASNS
jgi:hypothetical protein